MPPLRAETLFVLPTSREKTILDEMFGQFLTSEQIQIDREEVLGAFDGWIWHQYGRSEFHWGIGLTCTPNSDHPTRDALEIEQILGPNPGTSNQTQEFPFLVPNIPDVMLKWLHRLPWPVTKLKISKLLPSARIPAHIDANCEGMTRVHWVLQSGSNNFFFLNDRKKGRSMFRLSTGDIFAFDPNVVHSVKYGAYELKPRIHLVANIAVDYSKFSTTPSKEPFKL